MLAVPKPGILAIDIVEPLGASRPVVEISNRGESTPHGLNVLVERPSSLLIEILQPGALRLAVTPEDVSRPLTIYQLRNAFVPERQSPDQYHQIPDPPAVCNDALPIVGRPIDEDIYLAVEDSDNVDEWDCDVLELTLSGGGVLVLDSQDVDAVTVFAGPSCDVEAAGLPALDLDGLRYTVPAYAGEHRIMVETPDPYVLGLRFFALCRAAERDDHGDTFFCATPLTDAVVSGVLGDKSGIDQDVMTFVVEEQGAFVLSMRSASEVMMTLFDDNGLRLGEAEQRLARVLVPGRYFVRVRGAGAMAEEDYEVRIEKRP